MAVETQTERKPFITVEKMLGILEQEGQRLEADNARLAERNKALTAEIKAKEAGLKDLDSQVKIKGDGNRAELARLNQAFQKEAADLEQNVGPLRATVAQLNGQLENLRTEIKRLSDSKKDEIRLATKDAQGELDAVRSELSTLTTALTLTRSQLVQLAEKIQKAL